MPSTHTLPAPLSLEGIERTVHLLQAQLPGLLAVYAFGSRVHGVATPQSDLDLAVLVAGYADVHQLWSLSGELADVAGCPVDLLDLRAASTDIRRRHPAFGSNRESLGRAQDLVRGRLEERRSTPPVHLASRDRRDRFPC